jgi:hypothetical protein
MPFRIEVMREHHIHPAVFQVLLVVDVHAGRWPGLGVQVSLNKRENKAEEQSGFTEHGQGLKRCGIEKGGLRQRMHEPGRDKFNGKPGRRKCPAVIYLKKH